ncbi:MAG: radical SAM family heme chaperone HemW [Arachidicoccus sp.]|nr:radical SAM family heme chaperone HemW [Arachidicoccus sp.]
MRISEKILFIGTSMLLLKRKNTIQLSGIYIHIPYCKKACHYCDFHFSTTKYNSAEMMDCINKEMLLRKNYLQDEIETIYFGGGTPSLLKAEEIRRVTETIRNNFTVTEFPEITLEANPDDIDEESILQWKFAGINRLSIGVQSFHQKDLEWMNRAHDEKQALNCVLLAQDAGIENISCDLIYGTPLLTDEMWNENLNKIAFLKIPHLSAYALTVEPRTALHKMIEKKKVENINMNKQAHQFDMLMLWAKENNFEHYEISNFAKNGRRSKHNSSYWLGKHYLGIGPSAHSFNGNARRFNIANNALYIQSLKNNDLPFEEEILTKENKLNEYIMISLRTIQGTDLNKIEKEFDISQRKRIEELAGKYMYQGMIIAYNNYLILTDKGKHYADRIAADLFTV